MFEAPSKAGLFLFKLILTLTNLWPLILTVIELISEFKSGNLKEIFGCGTAAVIAPINSFGYKDEKFELEEKDNDFASRIKSSIINIQQNISDDTHNWRYKITE